MTQTYISKAGDVVDEIAFNQYGACTADTLNAMFAANPGLAGLGAILAAGVVITMPDAPPVTAPASQSVSLWD